MYLPAFVALPPEPSADSDVETFIFFLGDRDCFCRALLSALTGCSGNDGAGDGGTMRALTNNLHSGDETSLVAAALKPDAPAPAPPAPPRGRVDSGESAGEPGRCCSIWLAVREAQSLSFDAPDDNDWCLPIVGAVVVGGGGAKGGGGETTVKLLGHGLAEPGRRPPICLRAKNVDSWERADCADTPGVYRFVTQAGGGGSATK